VIFHVIPVTSVVEQDWEEDGTMPLVGADPDRLRELAHALEDAAAGIERTLAPAFAAVQTGWAPVPGDPEASGAWWRTVQAVAVALQDSAAQLRARADDLEADQRCAEAVVSAAGWFGLGFVLEAGTQLANLEVTGAVDTLTHGSGIGIVADTGFNLAALGTALATGSAAAGRMVAAAGLPVSAAVTLAEIYCMTPVESSVLAPTVNHQRGDDDEDWVDEDHIANTAGFTNCDSDCLVQLQGG
jgi:hypothetical protein